MMRPGAPLRAFDMTAPGTGLFLFAGALTIFAIIVAPFLVVDHPRPGPADFHHLWTAGAMWASGESPYDPARASLFELHGLAHAYEAPAPFFYPPHSIVLFGPLGFLPPGPASIAFALASAAALAGASVLGADIMRAAGVSGSRLSLASFHAIVLMAGWTATAVIFFHNIATLFIYAALLALLRGVQTRNGALTAAGAFFALISPQMSVPVVAAALLSPRTRGPIVLALAGVAIVSLAGLAFDGVVASLEGFLRNVADYSTYAANTHAERSGAGFLLAAAFDAPFGAAALLAACIATLAVFNLFGDREGENAEDRALEFLALAIVAGLFFLPSLNHYYIAALPALFFIARRKGVLRYFAIPAALVLMRSLDLSGAPDDASRLADSEIALLNSVAILVLFIAAASAWASGRDLSAPRFAALTLRRL